MKRKEGKEKRKEQIQKRKEKESKDGIRKTNFKKERMKKKNE